MNSFYFNGSRELQATSSCEEQYDQKHRVDMLSL